MEKHHFFSILIAVCVVVALALPSGLVVLAQEGEAPTPTEEPTAEPTEEPTAEPTEEPTEEPTAEPTEEPTAEPTEEPTEEPTAEPTEEPTAEPTLASSGVEAQAYSGSWTSHVAVQNMGTSDSSYTIEWYGSVGTDPCGTTSGTLGAGGAVKRNPPDNCNGATSYVGSAVVSSGDQVAAVVTNLGSVGNLASDYTGSSSPTINPLVVPLLSKDWDAMIGIQNAGTGQASVRVTILDDEGGTLNSQTYSIPAQYAVHVDVLSLVPPAQLPTWIGSVLIENDGTTTDQPLFAVCKAERSISGIPYPVSTAFEAFDTVADPSDLLIVPLVHRRVEEGNIPRGQNNTIGLYNPSETATVNVTLRYISENGQQAGTELVTLPPLGTDYRASRELNQLPTWWQGTARIESTGGPVLATVQPWFAQGTMTGYRAWAIFRPVDPNTATNTVYGPAIHKNSSGANRIGNGWCTSFMVVNVGATPTTVRVEFINESGTVEYTSPNTQILANGMDWWYTLLSDFDAPLGTAQNGFWGARVTVVSGPGPIIGLGQGSLAGYPDSDAYTFYNAVNQ